MRSARSPALLFRRARARRRIVRGAARGAHIPGRGVAPGWSGRSTPTTSSRVRLPCCPPCTRSCAHGRCPSARYISMPGNNETQSLSSSFWRDRPVLVTGASGLVGAGWCAGSGAGRRRRRARPRLGAALGARHVGTPRHGHRRARRRPGRRAARADARRVRDRHRPPPRGADDRRRRQQQPGVDAGHEHPGHVGTARGLPAQSPAVRQIVVASSDKAYGEQAGPAVHRGDAAPGAAPLRGEQVVRGPGRADVREELRPPGLHHPLRELLRWGRPELEPDCARHDPVDRA